MKYFIASRWSNMKNVQLLTENLQALGHEVYSFVTDKRNFVEAADLKNPHLLFEDVHDWRHDAGLREKFETNLEGLRTSDAVVLLLPAGKTSHINAGIGYGLGKHLVLIGEPEKNEIHYLIFDEVYPDIDAYVKALRSIKA